MPIPLGKIPAMFFWADFVNNNYYFVYYMCSRLKFLQTIYASQLPPLNIINIIKYMRGPKLLGWYD